MDDVIEIPSDRYAAHVFLAEQLTPRGGDRNFQWRMHHNGQSSIAIIRKSNDIVDVPESGNMVRFTIEAIPLSRVRGKRRYLYNRDDRINFITGTMIANAGLSVVSVDIKDSLGYIGKGDDRFVKPAVIFTGIATVIDETRLENALLNGIGQGKAYGYGMIILEEVA